MTEDPLVERIESNLFTSWRLLAGMPGVDLYDGPQMLRFASGVPFPLCNGVMRAVLDPVDPGAQIKQTIEFFRSGELPMLWWIGPSTEPEGLGRMLEERGLVKAETARGMAAELSALREPAVDAEIEIRAVEEHSGLDVWLEIFKEVYELPAVAIEFFSLAMQHAGYGPKSAFRHYLGFLEGSAVACSSTCTSGDTVGLYNVGTLPAARGRGVGIAASSMPLIEARSVGARIAVLHATDSGFPVYLRLGFAKLCEIDAYLLQ
jgi:GNAT superfamily N-acetyltransferase